MLCEETGELARFYAKHHHESIRERPVVDLMKAADEGLVTIAQDENENWLGVSCCFYKPGGDYAEIGGVRVIFERWGLQSLLMAASILTSYEMSPVNKALFAVTGATNGTSQKNLQGCGFQLHSPSAQLLHACHLRKFDPAAKVFLILPPPSPRPPLSPFQTILKTAEAAGALNKSGTSIPLSLNLPVISQLKASGNW